MPVLTFLLAVLAGAEMVRAGDAAPAAPGADEPKPITIAVLNFSNRNPGDRWDWLEKGLADMLITDLSNSPRLQVVERERMQLLFDELELQKRLTEGAGAEQPHPVQATAELVLEAAEKGDTARLKELLASAPKLLECRDEGGRTPLYTAASNGQKDTVAFLIESGADVNAEQKQKATPLHAAAAKGHDKVVELLLAKGAKVNAQNDLGTTPLHYAAAYGQEAVARLLLKKGADATLKDKEGRTPLDLAKKQGHKPVMQLLEGGPPSGTREPPGAGGGRAGL